MEWKAILCPGVQFGVRVENVNMNAMIMLNWDAGMRRGRGGGEGGRGGRRGDVRNISQLK